MTLTEDHSRRMASEKQELLEIGPVIESRRSSLHAHRKNVMIALCGIALLTIGAAIGIGMSMFCDQTLRGDLRGLSSPTLPTSAADPFNRINARALVGDTASTVIASVVAAVTATRPNKFFGPTIAPDLAAALKATKNLKSIEKRDSADTPDLIEVRDTIEKRAVWQPAPGLNWTYQLSEVPSSAQLKNASRYNVWDIDLFDVPASSMQTIQAAGSKVICYFSAGTDENWRSDSNKFQDADIGKAMGDWAGENWIDTRSTNVRKIMAARLDLAKSKGCDGVDPDNIDAYNHDTGFNLTQSDAVNYITFLARQASQRGIAISLKNSGDIVSKVINLVQYSVEEACSAYNECDLYKPFTDAGKAVFHVEYPKGYGTVNTATVSSSTMASICTCRSKYKLSPIVKNNNLDSWQQQCP